MKKNLSGPLSALARFLSLGWLSLCFLLVPWAQGQQVTRVGNLLTITQNNPALAAIPPEANGAIDVATTQSTSFALMPDGTVLAWGSDEYGLVSDAKYVRGAKKIVAGMTHAVALLENGTLYSWGSNDANVQATAVSIENAVDVVAAPRGTGVLKANGDAVVWGNFPESTKTFKSVSKLEMIFDSYDWNVQPIAIVYSKGGSLQFYSSANSNGNIDATRPVDLLKTVSVSCFRGVMVAIQSDSSVKTWVIQGRGSWIESEIKPSISPINYVNKAVVGAEVVFLKNNGSVWQPRSNGGMVNMVAGYENALNNLLSDYLDLRFIDVSIGGSQFLGIVSDKASGPIVEPGPSTVIVESGRPISFGHQVLLGDSFQWSKDREELLGPVNAQNGRILNITSASLSDSGVYINKITGNGKTVATPPINVIVREAGSPTIAVDGESIMYRYPDSLAIKRAGSASIAITTTAMGEDKIYYTLDGTQPSWLSSEAYIAPIVVSQTATLRVVVYTDDQWLVPVYSSPIEISIAPAYSLTINQSVGGKSTVAPLKASYFSGDTVTLKAYPDVGYRFVGWSNGNGSESTLNLTISANTSIQPLFEPIDSFAVSGMDSLIEGFKVRIVKPATARLITSVADAESVLDTNPDNLGQNESKISNVIDFRSQNGNRYLNGYNNYAITLPGARWEDSSVVEISGYTEIKSPGLYTLFIYSEGVHVFKIGDKTITGGDESGSPEAILSVRFDKPGYYKTRMVSWDNSDAKRLSVRIKKGVSYNGDWGNGSASNLGETQNGLPRVVSDLGYEIPGVGRVDAVPSGNLYYTGTAVQLTATASTGWEFMGWTGEAAGSAPSINLTVDRNIKAKPNFGRRLTLSKVMAPGSSGDVSTVPEGPLYAYDSTITVKGIPAQTPASYFKQWSPVTKFGTFNYARVKIDRFTPSLTAFFVAASATTDWLLNLTSEGRGYVTATPATGAPRSTFKEGDKVKLLAVAYDDSIFDYWVVNGTQVTGSTLDLTMTASQNVVAHFSEGLHVAAAEGANGQVRIVPQKAGYRVGETVQVTAVPADGYLLDRWSDVNTRETVRSITLSGSPGTTLTVGASFVAGVRINSTITGRGSIISVPAGPLYYPGTTVAISATPDYGSEFVRWGGALEGTGNKSLLLNATMAVQAEFRNQPNVPVYGSLVHWGRTDWGIGSVPIGSDFVQVSAGVNHAVALRVDGTVAAWGYPNGGENVTIVPTGLSGVKQVSGGNSFSLALKQDGTVAHWGGNRWSMALDASNVKDGIAVVSGSSGAVVLKNDGTVVGLGHANTIQSDNRWKDIVQIVGVPNQDVYLGLTRLGTVVAYHRDNSDWSERLNVPSDLKDVVQVALTERTAFAVKADGTVVSWGRDDWGLKSVANGLVNISRIEGGLYHFMAIDRSGIMMSYGEGWGVVPAAASRPSQATASQQFSLAIAPVTGLAPEILGSERGSIQMEVGDELLLGLGLEGRNVSQWQWQKATDTGWSDLSGKTSRRLQKASLTSADAGRYRVIASNGTGLDEGPESTVVVVPSGTPLISVNGIPIAGLPSETVKVRIGDSAAVRVSSRIVEGQLRYSLGGAAVTFGSGSTLLGTSEVVELGLGTHKFRAGVARSSDTVIVQSLTLELEVVPTYTLATSVGQGEGSVLITPTKGRYLKGDVVTVKATPALGFEFAGWDGISGTTAEVSLTMNQSFSPVAKFSVRSSYRIAGLDVPTQAGWKVVRVVDSTAKPVTITSDITTALAALNKTASEAQFYSETAAFISYRGMQPDNWYEANRAFPGGSQAGDAAQPKYALRASGFVEIPQPGTYTFGAVFSGPFRLRVGENEWLGGWETWRDARVSELKFARAGVYPIELIQWDENAQQSILLFAKSGAGASYFNDVGRFVNEGARFVGDVDRGGLRVWTELPNFNVAGVGTVTGSTGYSVFAGEAVTLKAEPATGWSFVRWEGDVSGSSATVTVTPTGDLRVKPIYATTLQLSAIADEAGNVHGVLGAVPAQGSYEYGSVVRLDVSADAGYGFEVFGGNVSALNGKVFAPATFRIDKASPTVTARFKELAAESLISVSVNPTSGGYVQVTPAKNLFKAGDSVTLTAVPAEGYLLDAWDGAASAGRALTRTITIQGDAGSAQTVGATFVAGVRLNTSVEGRGSVTVTPSASIYYAGTPVMAKATPAYGARFARWEGAGVGSADRSVTLNSTSSLKAIFENMPDVPVAGSLVYWGRTDHPVSTLPSGDEYTQVSVGYDHAVALKADGTVITWGNSAQQATSVPQGLNSVVQVSAGNGFTLALKSDGTVVRWPFNSTTNVLDAVQIAAGNSYGMVLKKNGTVMFVGRSDLSIPWSDIISIASAPAPWNNIFVGLKRNGTVLVWTESDWNVWGQTSVPNGLNNVVQIARSDRTVFALKADGTLTAWGSDDWGLKSSALLLKNVSRINTGLSHYNVVGNDGNVTVQGDSGLGVSIPQSFNNMFSISGGQQSSIGIVPITGLAPEIVGYEPASIQLEVGDEMLLGLGLDTRNGSRWQWQKASGSSDSTVWNPIAGQTSRRLRVAAVGLEDAGRYRVVASNDSGSDVGPEVSVVVIPSGTPVISVNGQVVQGKLGEEVSLKVGDAATVRFSTRMANGQIRYTLDGSLPSIASDPYSTPVNLEVGSHIVRVGVAPDGVSALLPGVTVKIDVVPTFSIGTSIGQGEGTISVIPLKLRYLQGETVTLKASADPGFNFTGWTGVNATAADVALTVSENIVAKADFTPKPTYRIIGADQPSKAGWNVVRAVIESGSTAALESSLASALELLGKGTGEVVSYSETAPYIYYSARVNEPGWFDGWEFRFPGDAKPRVGSEKKAALRATGFIEIPNPGSWTFLVRNSGSFRLKVGEQEFSMAGEDTWNNGRVFTAKIPKAGVYPIELVAWDTQEGNSLLMLMARSGARKDNDEDPNSFVLNNGGKFVGDVDRGGLRVWSELPNLSMAGVGTVTGASGYSVYSGDTATLTAEPVTGWTFVRWEGDVSGTESSITVTPDRNLKVKPVFSTALQLTAGTGGTLTAVPSLTRYEYGTVVRLEATPSAGYGFQKFNSLNVAEVKNKTFTPATLTVTQANPAVSAVFVALVGTGQLSLRVNPTSGGYVQVSPAKNLFQAGDSVTLTAVPAEGYLLDAWDGVASADRALTRTITIEGVAGSAQTVGATFVAGVRLNTSVAGRGSVTVTPSAALYYAGTSVTAKATPAYGARFVRWEPAGEGVTDRSVTLTSTSSLKAVFENMPDVPVAGRLVFWGRSDSRVASVPSGSDFVQVSIANNHALALKVDGTVVAWGDYSGIMFGNNTVTNIPAGLSGVKKVAAGNMQSLALKTDGTLAYWGKADWNLPSEAAAIRDAVDIAAGESGSIVLKADGSVVGIGHANTIQWKDIVKIAAYPSINTFLGLRKDGAVLAYQRDGNDWAGRLSSSINSSIFSSRDNVSIGLSETAAYLVKRDGSVVTWGQDWGGVKNYIPTLTGVNRVVGGWYHLLIEGASGTITTFGDAPWSTPMPSGASTSFGVTAGQQASIGIVPIVGLAPEIVGAEPNSVQFEVGDEMVLGLGLETRNGSRWQWHKATDSGASTVWNPVAGQTTRRLRIASVVNEDSGRYRLVASNDNGSDVGPEVSVAVVAKGTPRITVNGVAVNGMPGEAARLRVGDRAKVTLSTRLEGGQIYYSTDGEEVSIASFEYTPTTDLDLGVGSYGIRAGVDAGGGGALLKGIALDLEVVPTYSVATQIVAGEGSIELRPNKVRYLQDEVFGVVAKAAAGFEFAGWDGISGSGATTEVRVSQNLSIGARFRTLPIFRIVGTEAPSQAGWKVTRLVSADGGAINGGTNGIGANLVSAIAAFSSPAASVQSSSETAAYINYRGHNPGNWLQENRAYPGGSQAEGSAQVPFVVKASGYVEVPEPGSWTFGVVFSGPFRLKVGESEWQGGWDTWQDGRMTVLNFPRAGVYPIELLQWDQNPNQASLLLFARRGGLPGYDSNVGQFYNDGARFVGDVDRGGLRVWSELPGLDVTGVGRVTGSPSFSVIAGQSVQLTAEPSTGWTFVRWSGDVSGTDPVLSLTPTSDLRIKPIFATTVALSVPNGNGTLQAIPASGSYEYGSKVRLQATPETGFGFQRFTVNIPGLTGMNLTPTEITVNRPSIQVAASFVSLTASTPGFVAVDLGTPSGGLVAVTPAKNLFNPGASVSAKATADPGWFFTGWESPVVSTQSQVQFLLPNTAGSVSQVRAKFVEGVALKALVLGRGRVVSNPPEAIHFPGSTVQLVAEAASGARFVRWQTAETLENPTSPNLSLVMSQVRELTAVFENDANSREFGRLVGNGTSLAQSQVLPAGDDFVLVSLGTYHALALRLNGTVEAWGDNRFGQVTVPTGLSGVRSVVAGFNYSLALKEDGSVVGWGQGIQGINLGILPRDITSMVAGASHVVFLRSNGLAMPMKLRGGALGSVPLVPAVIPPEFGYPLSVVDSADRGFTVRMFQASQSNGGLPNGNARAEAQIAGVLTNTATGKPYENIIDTSKAAFEPDGSYWEKKSIYYNQDFSGDRQFPGIPGKEGHTDNMAMEVVTWLELKSGKYSMVVNSDDSFRVSVGRDLSERLSWPYIGEFNAGRGASDTEFSFEVAEAGIYGFRLVYDEGNGGANCYWYVTGVPGSTNRLMTLINDDTDPSKHVVKAYRRVQVPPQIAGQAESVSQVAANIGTQSILFLKRDGTVAAYSDTDGFGQTTIPTGINDLVQVALSRTGAYGLRSNGKVVVWGTVDAQVKTAIEALPKVVSLAASGSQIWLYDQAGQVVSFMDDGNQPSQPLVAQGTRIKSPQFQGVTALAVAPYSGFSPYVSGFTPSEFAVENGGRLFLGTGLVPESGSSLIWEFSASGTAGSWTAVPAGSLTQTGLPVFDPITPAASGFYRWTARNDAGSLVGSPIRVVSRPAGSPVLLVDGVPYEQSGSAELRVFGSSTIAVRSSAVGQNWKLNLGGARAPVSIKSGEVYSLGLGSFTVSAEATVAGVDLKSVELPVTVVPIYEVKSASGLMGGTFQLEVVDSDYTVPQSMGYRVGAGAMVRATAAPAYGYRIKSWKGFTGEVSTVLSFTVNSDRVVEPEFEAIPTFGLTIVDGVDRGGSIFGVQPTLSQLNAIGNRLLQGSALTLRADPRPGFVFKGWKISGTPPVTSAENPLTLTVNADVSVEALFETTMTVQSGLVGGGVQSDLSGSVVAGGSTGYFQAVPEEGRYLANWSIQEVVQNQIQVNQSFGYEGNDTRPLVASRFQRTSYRDAFQWSYADMPEGSTTISPSMTVELSGVFYPPAASFYQFKLQTEGFGELWISRDANPDNLVRVAADGDNFPLAGMSTVAGDIAGLGSTSLQLSLKAGQGYYVRVRLFKAAGQAGSAALFAGRSVLGDSMDWETDPMSAANFRLPGTSPGPSIQGGTAMIKADRPYQVGAVFSTLPVGWTSVRAINSASASVNLTPAVSLVGLGQTVKASTVVQPGFHFDRWLSPAGLSEADQARSSIEVVAGNSPLVFQPRVVPETPLVAVRSGQSTNQVISEGSVFSINLDRLNSDRWWQQVSSPSTATNPTGSNAGTSSPTTASPSTSSSPSTASGSTGGWLSNLVEQWLTALSNLLFSDNPDSTVDVQLVEGPSGMLVTEQADKSFRVSWTTTEADGPSVKHVLLRARFRSNTGEVMAIQEIPLSIEVTEVNQNPSLVRSGSDQDPLLVNSGIWVEVPLNAVDQDLPLQSLEATILSGPAGSSLSLGQAGLQNGGRVNFRWLASEGLGARSERVTIGIKDSLGLDSQTAFNLLVPAVPPVLTLSAPDSGTVSDERITVSGSASDNSGAVSVKLLRDGQYVADLPVNGGLFSYRIPTRLTNPVTRITVVAMDAAGNTTSVDRNVEWTPLRRPILGALGSLKDGQKLVVPLGLETPGDVSGMAFALTYDSTYLKSPEVTFKNSLPGSVMLANADKPGEIRITLSSASGKTLPGGIADLADISFRARSVPDTVQTQIRVAIEDTSDARGRAHTFGNGNAVAPVEIRRRTYVGDNNGNDLIDVGDAYLIQRKLVRLDLTEPWDVVQNDLNASDSIDSGDVTSVLRIVVDLDPIQTLAGANSVPGFGPSAALSRVVGSGALGGTSVEKRSTGFRIASGSAQGKARAGVVTLRHSPAWVITQKSVSIVGQVSGGALLSVATHIRDAKAYTRISYLLSQESGADGVSLEIQPDQGLEFGGLVSLLQWSYSKSGFDLINATVEPTEIDFPVVPSLVESLGVIKTSSGMYLNLRGIPNTDYSIQSSMDLNSWLEIQRHTANGELQQLPIKSDGQEAGFYRSVRVVGNQGISNK